MNILLVGGSLNSILYSKITHQKCVINKKTTYSSEVMDLLEEEAITIDKVMIIDEGIDQSFEAFCTMLKQTRLIEDGRLLLISRNLAFMSLGIGQQLSFYDSVYISYEQYVGEFERIAKLSTEASKQDKHLKIRKQQESEPTLQKEEKTGQREFVEPEEKKERISIFAKFRRNKEKEVKEDNRFSSISSGISRVIAVTGHRGVGVTSSAVNLASESAKKHLSTIIVDLDIFNRTTNLYFGEFIRQVERDEHMAASLIKCLAKPQEYKNNACNLSDKLWLTTLGYDFEDHRLTEQFYTTIKLMNMLTILKQSFNVIILDLPLEILGKFHEVIPNVDIFALCVNNSQYSVITTLQNMGNYLSNEEIGYLNAKSKLLITRYNDRAQCEDGFFTPDRVSELFASDLCEEMKIQMPVAGYIRYYDEFDSQMERDIPISELNSEYKEYYAGALVRLLEGGR